MAIFGPEPWVNPLRKMLIFRLFVLLVFIGQKGVFSFQNIIKDIFLAYNAEKKKVGKMAVFGPKPWVNPLGIMPIFRLFGLPVFIAQKGVFSFQDIIKDIFLAYISQKKKVGKMAIFGPKPWLKPLGKMSIFRLFGLLVFIDQKGGFSFQNITKDIFLAYIAQKKKSWKNGRFWTKTMG